MTAFITLKFKVSTLNTLKHEKLLAIPLFPILDHEDLRERLLARPLHLNQFAISLQWYVFVTVNVVLNLRDICVRRFIRRSLVCQGWLEPIGNFKHVSRLQLLIIFVPFIFRIKLPNSLQILPLEYLLVRKQRRHIVA